MATNADCGEELERLRQQQSDPWEAVDHALRTPLQSLKGFAGELDAGLPHSDLEYCVSAIKRDAAQLADVWEDLWLRHRLKRGPLTLRPVSVDWETLLAEQARVFESFFPDCLVEWESCGDVPQLSADPDRLWHILWTLLRTANRCRPDTQPPHLFTTFVVPFERPHRIVFRVAGEGLHMPPGDLTSIFDEYRLGAGGQNRPRTGVGLGFYVAREVARQMGGDVSILTEEAGLTRPSGCAFDLALPVSEG